MLESMEELADAIEDAQYVNAIATQDDGPKPVIPWEQPTPLELLEWEQSQQQQQSSSSLLPNNSHIQNHHRRPRQERFIHDTTTTTGSTTTTYSSYEAFSMEWICQQPIGLYLFSDYIKRHHKNDNNSNSKLLHHHHSYIQINFIEEVIRFRNFVQQQEELIVTSSSSSTSSSPTKSSSGNYNSTNINSHFITMMKEERLLYMIQILRQFFGYKQIPELVVPYNETQDVSVVASPPTTTTTQPIDTPNQGEGTNNNNITVDDNTVPTNTNDPSPTTTTTTVQTTIDDQPQDESQQEPQPTVQQQQRRYIWKTIPLQTEIDEYDLARPSMEYYYYHQSNDNNNPPNQSQEVPIESTETHSSTTATNGNTESSSTNTTTTTTPNDHHHYWFDMSEQEYQQWVYDSCDYPICSQSIIGIKGLVYDTIRNLLQQQSNLRFYMEKLKTGRKGTKQHQQQQHRSSSTSFSINNNHNNNKSDYRFSSSDFFMNNNNNNNTSGGGMSPTWQQQLHDSHGSLLSYQSSSNYSERTHYRNIPAEQVFDALDASLFVTSSSSPPTNHQRKSSLSTNHKNTTTATTTTTNTTSRQSLTGSASPSLSLLQSENDNYSSLLNTSQEQQLNSNTNNISRTETTKFEAATSSRVSIETIIDIPIHIFDAAECIIMESIRQQYWIPFTASSHYMKCKHFLWYQDRKIIPDDFYVLRVLGRGGFGLVTACKKGTSGKLYAMKVMNKRRIKMKRSESLTLNERNALAAVESKFVINLKYSFQSSEDIYLILDLMTGGDLGYHLHQRRRFPKRECLYYSARIMLGLQALHDTGYVFRDIKPENCLLADDGRVKITDLGLATKITPTLNGAAGTRGYWAPEMLQRDIDGKRLTYDHAVDWFSFGCCVAEFISGTNPFRSEPAITFGKERGKTTKEKMIDCATVEMNPVFSSEFFESDAADLCRRLLDKNPTTRLGRNGCEEIMAHSWFKTLNWESIISDRKRPPFIPPRDVNAASQSQIGNFAEDKVYHETVLTPADERIYKDWDWTNPRAFAAEVIEFWIYERVTGEPLVPMSQNNGCCCTIT